MGGQGEGSEWAWSVSGWGRDGGKGLGELRISMSVCGPACYWREVELQARGGECFRLVEVQTRWSRVWMIQTQDDHVLSGDCTGVLEILHSSHLSLVT